MEESGKSPSSTSEIRTTTTTITIITIIRFLRYKNTEQAFTFQNEKWGWIKKVVEQKQAHITRRKVKKKIQKSHVCYQVPMVALSMLQQSKPFVLRCFWT